MEYLIKYKIITPHKKEVKGEELVEEHLYMNAAWKLQQQLKKKHGHGANILIDLNNEKDY